MRRRAVGWMVLSVLGVGASPAWGALPAVTVKVSPLALIHGPQTGKTVSAACPAGSMLVGGGGYLRNAADPATVPTAALVLGGTMPSTGATPVDVGAPGLTNDV